MTVPVLQLRPEALEHPSELDLAAVEAVMYWPNDEDARNKWMVAAMVEFGWAHIEDMSEAELRH